MMLALVVASALSTLHPSARLLPVDDVQENEGSSAQPGEGAPVAPVPAPPPLPTSAYVPKKSVSFLLATGEFLVGAAAGYGGLLLGILANFRNGGLSIPPDAADILLLGVLPASLAAGGAWLIGLFDLSQRGFISNLLFAIIGGALGELIGVGAGVLVGRSAAPSDPSLAGIIAVSMGPAFAALGATLCMEIFKPGELPASATLLLLPDRRGGMIAGPALVGSW